MSRSALPLPSFRYLLFSQSISSIEASSGTAVATSPAESSNLTQAIQVLAEAGKIAYSKAENLPTPATIYKRWKPQEVENAPHDPNAYWPMNLVK